MASPTTLAITAPGPVGVVLAELDEFATNVMHDPWDMNQPADLAFYRTVSQMVGSTFANGIYSAQMTSGLGGERITLLSAGAQNNAAMRIGKIGYNYPIDANHYRYLTYRLFKGNSQCNSGLIQWFADDSYSSSSMGVSNSFPIPPTTPCSGWHTIVIDLSTIGIQLGQKGWSGTIRELIIKPFAGSGAAGAAVKLDWARLTVADPRTARPYPIRWSGNGTGGEVTLYASRGNKTLDASDIIIAQGQSPSGGTFVFQTGVLPSGSYYIAASNGSGIVWSVGPLEINAPPQTTITRPSMISGKDYAETEKSDAWDMDNSGDLNDFVPLWWETCVSNVSFAGGIYRANIVQCANTTIHTDPKLLFGHMQPLGPDPLIDTAKYRYYSFRYLHSGTQDVGQGWVSRLGWWQDTSGVVTEDVVMSRDIILQEGWNIYKADLYAPDVVDEAHPVQRAWKDSAPNRLRFDPNELHMSLLPASIQIDWIKLTAMDEIDSGSPFPIRYDTDSSRSVVLTFYYDTDKNPSNGRTLLGTEEVLMAGGSTMQSILDSKVINANHSIYLPVLYNHFTNINCTYPGCYLWDTTGVPLGTYFICASSQDAYNSTYRCSEAPMKVN